MNQPCCGDILLNPTRMVCRVNTREKTFETHPFDETPDEVSGGDLPLKMRGKGWEQAPIDPSYTETRLTEEP